MAALRLSSTRPSWLSVSSCWLSAGAAGARAPGRRASRLAKALALLASHLTAWLAESGLGGADEARGA